MSESKKEDDNIYSSISSVMREMKAIPKDSRNILQNFNYRSIVAICNELNPLFAKYGLFTLPIETIIQEYSTKNSMSGKELTFCKIVKKYRIYARDGSFIEGIGCGEAFDSGDKSTGKASTFAYKNFLTETFCIADEKDDPDAHTVPDMKNEYEKKRAYIANRLENIASLGNTESIDNFFDNMNEEEKKIIGVNKESTISYYKKKAEKVNQQQQMEKQ